LIDSGRYAKLEAVSCLRFYSFKEEGLDIIEHLLAVWCLSRDGGYVDVHQRLDTCNSLLREKHEDVCCGIVLDVLKKVANPDKIDMMGFDRVRSSPGVEDF